MKKTYTEKRFKDYYEDDLSVTLRSQSGSYGGGSEVLIIDTLVFDNAQITSKLNYSHPTWGGQCHPLTSAAGQAIVVIKHEVSRNDSRPPYTEDK